MPRVPKIVNFLARVYFNSILAVRLKYKSFFLRFRRKLDIFFKSVVKRIEN